MTFGDKHNRVASFRPFKLIVLSPLCPSSTELRAEALGVAASRGLLILLLQGLAYPIPVCPSPRRSSTFTSADEVELEGDRSSLALTFCSMPKNLELIWHNSLRLRVGA